MEVLNLFEMRVLRMILVVFVFIYLDNIGVVNNYY